jgi:hypothetical protein
MPKGFNHSTQLAMSMAASTGRLFGLSPSEIAQAIATVDSVSLACMHVEPVTMGGLLTPHDRHSRCLRCFVGQAWVHRPKVCSKAQRDWKLDEVLVIP